jgi:hypothetical protein
MRVSYYSQRERERARARASERDGEMERDEQKHIENWRETGRELVRFSAGAASVLSYLIERERERG